MALSLFLPLLLCLLGPFVEENLRESLIGVGCCPTELSRYGDVVKLFGLQGGLLQGEKQGVSEKVPQTREI